MALSTSAWFHRNHEIGAEPETEFARAADQTTSADCQLVAGAAVDALAEMEYPGISRSRPRRSASPGKNFVVVGMQHPIRPGASGTPPGRRTGLAPSCRSLPCPPLGPSQSSPWATVGSRATSVRLDPSPPLHRLPSFSRLRKPPGQGFRLEVFPLRPPTSGEPADDSLYVPRRAKP